MKGESKNGKFFTGTYDGNYCWNRCHGNLAPHEQTFYAPGISQSRQNYGQNE